MALKLYTVKEVAEISGFKERTIRNLLSNGTIIKTKVNKATRIKKEDLESWLGMEV